MRLKRRNNPVQYSKHGCLRHNMHKDKGSNPVFWFPKHIEPVEHPTHERTFSSSLLDEHTAAKNLGPCLHSSPSATSPLACSTGWDESARAARAETRDRSSWRAARTRAETCFVVDCFIIVN